MSDASAVPTVVRAASFARAVVARLDRRNLALAGVVVVGLVALASYGMVPSVWGASTPTVRARVFHTAFTTVLLILAIVVADEAVDRGLPRIPAYVAAVLGASLVGALLGYELRGLLGLRYGPQGIPHNANAAFPFVRRADIFLIVGLVGGLATFVHVNRRTALAARRRQHDAERARAGAQRRTLELQLQALQARVEPVFLFGTLDRIRQLYHTDAGLGSAMLEDLIVYLRAALPHLRESASTVMQETTLTRAWLDIVRRSMPSLKASFDVDDSAAGARLPALVLLPLVQQAVEDSATRPCAVRVAIRANGDRLRIEVTTTTPAFAARVARRSVLEQIDERLRALFGPLARFDSGPADVGGESRAIVELPFAIADELAHAGKAP
jgi:hypothetical protein